MFTWIRSHQRKLMTVVAVLTIVAFVVLYNAGSLETLGRSDFAKIYGRSVSMTELQREARLAGLAVDLGLGEYVSALSAGQDPDSVDDFVFNSIILRREAEDLGIRPTTEDIKNAITGLPIFQTNGQFDSQKYISFSENALAPRGFSESQIEEVVRDSMRFERVRDLIEAPVAIQEGEILNTAKEFQKVRGQVIYFDQMDFMDNAEIPEETIVAAYERAKPQLNAPEHRAVEYVTFSLPEAEKALEGTERVKALQKVADASLEFADKAAASTFAATLSESGLTPRTTLDFTAQGLVVTEDGLPSAAASLADPLQVLARPVFQLRGNSKVTGVIRDDETFYVANLIRESPSRTLTLDESRAQLVQGLRLEAARGRMEEAAVTGMATVREALAAGQSFSDAATSAGLRVEAFDASPMDNVALPEQRRYAEAAIFLNPGELGEYIPTGSGGFAVMLENREPLDDATLAEQREVIEQVLMTRRASVLFYDWLVSARVRSGLQIDESNI